MESNNKSIDNYRAGISFSGALALLFIALKLTGYINWPWLWVLAPLWVPAATLITVIVVPLAIISVVSLCSWLYKKVTR